MTLSEPRNSVSKVQFVMMNPNAAVGIAPAKLELSDNFFIASNDDHSVTSSTMSDEASWISEHDLDEDEKMEMAKGAAHAVAKMVRDRSTVSLGAYIHQEPETQPTTAIKRPHATGPVMGRTASVANFRTPGIMKRTPTKGAIQRVSAQHASPDDTINTVKPGDHLCKLLDTQLDRVPFASLGDYFLKTTPEHIAAWDSELLRSIRTQDLALLQKMHQTGTPLQACNQFGESILHVCVRRGTPAILKYLLYEGQVSPKVHCDYGRTPLHDAFWTFAHDPNSVQMIALLLKQCPEMLLVTDKRGCTPLDYVPRDRWNDCCRLLDRCLPLLTRLKNNGRH